MSPTALSETMTAMRELETPLTEVPSLAELPVPEVRAPLGLEVTVVETGDDRDSDEHVMTVNIDEDGVDEDEDEDATPVSLAG